MKDAQKLLGKSRIENNNRISITQTRLDLLHLPIVDGSITSDTALSRLADDCCQRILDGQKLYVHCWGGHGRTGTLVAVMLGRLYGLSAPEALAYTQATHDARKCPQGVRSPQTSIQVEQVRRLLDNKEPGAKALSYRWPTSPLIKDPSDRGEAEATSHKEEHSSPSMPSKESMRKESKSPVINIKARAGISPE